jgi:hypothetical protein
MVYRARCDDWSCPSTSSREPSKHAGCFAPQCFIVRSVSAMRTDLGAMQLLDGW